MNDADIIKALECLRNGEILCKECAYKEIPYPACKALVAGHALNLIKRQKAEIERLQKYNTEVAYKHYNDGIKEFAERLKESAFECDVSFGFGREHYTKAVTVIEIDNLVKEMTEVEQHE